jgi:hypothetical protein
MEVRVKIRTDLFDFLFWRMTVEREIEDSGSYDELTTT